MTDNQEQNSRAAPLRAVAHRIIAATGDGVSSGIRMAVEKIGLIAPKARFSVSGRNLIAQSHADRFTMRLAPPLGPNERLRYATIELDPEPLVELNISAALLGLDGKDQLDPSHQYELARTVARIARIIAFGDLLPIDGDDIAFTLNKSQVHGFRILAETCLCVSGYGAAKQKIVLNHPAGERPKSISYQNIDARIKPHVCDLILKGMPDAVLVTIPTDGNSAYINPLNLSVSLHDMDAVSMLRRANQAENDYGNVENLLMVPVS